MYFLTLVLLFISTLLILLVIHRQRRFLKKKTTRDNRLGKKVVLICGPSGSGKTVLWLSLCGKTKWHTTISATVNRGMLADNNNYLLVDVPGSPSLSHKLIAELELLPSAIILIASDSTDPSFDFLTLISHIISKKIPTLLTGLSFPTFVDRVDALWKSRVISCADIEQMDTEALASARMILTSQNMNDDDIHSILLKPLLEAQISPCPEGQNFDTQYIHQWIALH